MLVGTVSVEKSEVVARMLRKKGIPHNVLNAKQHEREAYVVAQAGRKGAVTISTNMAGRGTDIILGGNAEFMARAEVDPEKRRQARRRRRRARAAFKEAFAQATRRSATPRSRRCSPPAACTSSAPSATSRAASTTSCAAAPAARATRVSSRFYLSLEDDLMRIFGGERITGLMERLGMEEDVPDRAPAWINRAIENAQKKVEGHNFDIRKNLLEYDDVMNQQRKTIYALRRQVLEGRYAPEPTEEEKKTAARPPPTRRCRPSRASTPSRRWLGDRAPDRWRACATR